MTSEFCRPVVDLAVVQQQCRTKQILLTGMMFDQNIRHIPFRGNAPGIQAVVANRTSQKEVKPFVGDGQLRAIATTGKRRDRRFPDLPTVSEDGVEGYATSWWHALFVPAGTPSSIVEKLATALQDVMQDGEGRSQLEEIGLVAQYRSPEDVTGQTLTEVGNFKKIAEEISLD